MVRWDRRIALVCAVAGVLLLLTTLSFVFVDAGLSQRTTFLLFAGLALVIAYAVADPGAVVELVRTRRVRFGSLSVLVSAMVVGVLIAVNVFASRSTQAADFTRSGLHTLSPRSVLVARQLESDLLVTGFFRPDQQQSKRDAQTLLNLYKHESPHVKVRFVDPDQNAAEAVRLGVKIAGSLVLQHGDRPPVVLNLVEQTEPELTSAILRLDSSRTPVVCWASGDGERDHRDANQVSGYSAAADLLRTSNYQIQDVLLVQQGVPSTCDVLVLLQLGRPLSDGSVKAVQDYLSRGGKMLMGIDPWLDPKVLASANALVKPFSVNFDGSLVVETDPAHSAKDDPTVPVVFDYGQSPITKDIAGKYVFLPVATFISGTAAGNATSLNLTSTTGRSYAIAQQRTNLDRRPIDKSGPFVLMQTVEEKHTEGKTTRIVLAGTSGVAENRTMPPYADGSNPDLFLASLDWLSEQDALISIGPKPPAAAPLTLTDQDVRFNQILTLGVMPLLAIAIGALVFMRRRRAPTRS